MIPIYLDTAQTLARLSARLPNSIQPLHKTFHRCLREPLPPTKCAHSCLHHPMRCVCHPMWHVHPSLQNAEGIQDCLSSLPTLVLLPCHPTTVLLPVGYLCLLNAAPASLRYFLASFSAPCSSVFRCMWLHSSIHQGREARTAGA